MGWEAMSRMVKVEEFAEEMNVSPNLIYKLVSFRLRPEDRLPHYRPGDLVRIDADEGREWMRARAMGESR